MNKVKKHVEVAWILRVKVPAYNVPWAMVTVAWLMDKSNSPSAAFRTSQQGRTSAMTITRMHGSRVHMAARLRRDPETTSDWSLPLRGMRSFIVIVLLTYEKWKQLFKYPTRAVRWAVRSETRFVWDKNHSR